MKEAKQTSSPFGSVLMYGLLHNKTPVVSRSAPPLHEKPTNASLSSPNSPSPLCYVNINTNQIAIGLQL